MSYMVQFSPGLTLYYEATFSSSSQASEFCLMRQTAFAFLRSVTMDKPERMPVVWMVSDNRRNTSEVPLLWEQPLQ